MIFQRQIKYKLSCYTLCLSLSLVSKPNGFSSSTGTSCQDPTAPRALFDEILASILLPVLLTAFEGEVVTVPNQRLQPLIKRTQIYIILSLLGGIYN